MAVRTVGAALLPLPLGPELCDPLKANSGGGAGQGPSLLRVPLPPRRWSRLEVTIPQAVQALREDPPLTVPTGPALAPLPSLKAGTLPMIFCFVLGILLGCVSLILGVQWYRRGACRGRW